MFIETLKVINGKFETPEEHFARLSNTQKEIYGISSNFFLENSEIPFDARKGIVKCRILYDDKIKNIEYFPYNMRNINSLKIINTENIRYDKKFADRRCFENLLKFKGLYDDILICINNEITDTSFSNIVFSDGENFYTPSSYLLNGVRRQQLLNKGIIKELKMQISDISSFQKAYLINTMISIDDNVSLPVSMIED